MMGRINNIIVQRKIAMIEVPSISRTSYDSSFPVVKRGFLSFNANSDNGEL